MLPCDPEPSGDGGGCLTLPAIIGGLFALVVAFIVGWDACEFVKGYVIEIDDDPMSFTHGAPAGGEHPERKAMKERTAAARLEMETDKLISSLPTLDPCSDGERKLMFFPTGEAAK